MSGEETKLSDKPARNNKEPPGRTQLNGASEKTGKPGKRRRREEEALLDAVADPAKGGPKGADSDGSEEDERELNLRPNIRSVVYCNFKFRPWYRSPRYFDESAPSGVLHCSTSLHLTKQQVKGAHTKEIQGIRQANTKRAKANGGDEQAKAASQAPPAETTKDAVPDDEGVLIDTLYVCDTCFKYTSVAKEMAIHVPKCQYRTQLPGRVVYDSPYYQIRKIDGARHLLYAQCLSLFAKLFLDHKSICYALEMFDFYILTTSIANIEGVNEFASNPKNGKPQSENASLKKQSSRNMDQQVSAGSRDVSLPLSAQRVLGFFSKEKVSWDSYNLACITIFPPFQKRGLGKLLIEYSYYLSRKTRLIGTPERPLSSEGLLTYLKYWSNSISMYIATKYHEHQASGSGASREFPLSINDISHGTYISGADVMSALAHMGALVHDDGTDGQADQGVTSTKPVRIDLGRILAWFEQYKKKPSLVPMYLEYCIIRKKSRGPKPAPVPPPKKVLYYDDDDDDDESLGEISDSDDDEY